MSYRHGVAARARLGFGGHIEFLADNTFKLILGITKLESERSRIQPAELYRSLAGDGGSSRADGRGGELSTTDMVPYLFGLRERALSRRELAPHEGQLVPGRLLRRCLRLLPGFLPYLANIAIAQGRKTMSACGRMRFIH